MYKEIDQLKNIIEINKISFEPLEEDYLDRNHFYKAVIIIIDSKLYKIYVDHEYKDLDLNVPELNLYLVLNQLEILDECKNYEEWCADQMIENSEKTKDYYRDFRIMKDEIKNLLGSIDPIITQMDFELNSGPIQFLRNQ